ncbi:MAG TPA: EF-hand domain-containing protein [Arenimonas sp.]|nr:EF-hand domain-containing protein [Arenimonas sp.]HOZ05168.1 EF-hand domain-containing protein [Arenimonas sp.]HPO23123.1 EF-hand domain-containing protein [Arenimonas sp.]HPW33248.1 EF-hand domain-containing protein [Arenimonas sp.]
MKKVIPILVIGFMSISMLANAQSQSNERRADMQAKAQERFHALDANNDGKISYAEFQNNPKQRERFDKADLNRDGGLTQDEIRQAHQQMKQQRQERRAKGREKMQAMREKMKRLDVNNDQALTRAEIGNELPKLSENFDIIDGNNDGKITREEMRIARMAMRAERQSQSR